MKYEFGVMSSKYSLEAKQLIVAKMAMVLFIKQNVPIAIYEPYQSAEMPIDILKSFEAIRKETKYPKEILDKEIRECYKTIKEVKLWAD